MVKCWIRLVPEQLDAMRQLARKLSYEEDADLSWADVLRRGAELILKNNETSTENPKK